MSQSIINQLVNLGGKLDQFQYGTQVITFDDSVLRVTQLPYGEIGNVSIFSEGVIERYPSANIRNVITSLIEHLTSSGAVIHEHFKVPERRAYFQLMVSLNPTTKEDVESTVVGIEVFVGKDALDSMSA